MHRLQHVGNNRAAVVIKVVSAGGLANGSDNDSLHVAHHVFNGAVDNREPVESRDAIGSTTGARR